MKKEIWQKIDIKKFQEKAEVLIGAGALESAYVSNSRESISGEIIDGPNEFEIAVTISEQILRSYCSLCRVKMCEHKAALIMCYMRSAESFMELEEVPFLKTAQGQKGKSLKAPREIKGSLKLSKSKRELFLEGLDLSQKILKDWFDEGVGARDAGFIQRLNEQINRLDEFGLMGIKLKILELMESVAITEPDQSFIFKVYELNKIIEDSKTELNLKQGMMPISELAELRGYIWKYYDLKLIETPVSAQMIQLSFSTSENTLAARLEEVGIWLNLDDGELYRTVNLRPFKALRFIPADDSFFEVKEVNELVKYPGNHLCRVKWKSDIVRSVSLDDRIKIQSYAKKLTKEYVDAIKKRLRETPYAVNYHSLIEIEEVVQNEKGLCFKSNGQAFPVEDCMESDLLYTLGESASLVLLVAIKPDFSTNSIVFKPLTIISDNSIKRLGF